MQTYGFGVWANGPNSQLYNFVFPIFKGDGKTVLPVGEASPYKDALSKTGNVFCRIRSKAAEWQCYNPTVKAIVVVQGGFSYVTTSQSRVDGLHKDENILIWTSLCRKSSSCEVTVQMTEYRFRPIIVSGKPVVSYDQKTVSEVVYNLPYNTSLTNPSLEALASPVIFRLRPRLVSKTYTYMARSECTKYETGQRVFLDQSEYAGIATTHYESMIALGVPGTYRAMSAAQSAYVKAAGSLPAVESNGLANISEISGIFAALLRRDIGSTAKHLNDAWLAYRYAYTTTLLDISEYSAYINRILYLSQPSVSDIHAHGYFTDADGWKYHVSLTLSASEILPDTTKKILSDFGFELTAVNAWDMVPYSFIIDWFIPVADALDLWESHWKSRDLQVQQAWLSITSPTGDCYVRGPTSWSSAPPLLSVSKTRTKTIFMRIADAIALLSK